MKYLTPPGDGGQQSARHPRPAEAGDLGVGEIF